jgi:hypothetical protein
MAKPSIIGKLRGRCKASKQAVIRGMHRGKQRGQAPLPKQIKTEHPREARKLPAGHPRDAPRRIEAQEARRSMQGVEPSGHPRDGQRKAKGAPLQKQVKVEHPREVRNSPAGHPSDAPRRMEAQEAPKVDARHQNVMNPSPPGLRLTVERLSIEVDRASWVATMVTTISVLLVLGWLLAFR